MSGIWEWIKGLPGYLPSLPTWLWVVIGIVGGLTLLITIMLSSSVVAKIEYHGDFTLKAKYLGFTIYDSRKKHKSKKKRKARQAKQVESKAAPKQSFADKVAEQSGINQTLDDVKKANKRSFDLEMYKLIYDSAKLPIKHMVRKTRVTNLRLNCVIGGDDAFRIAINYGLQSAAVSAGLAWLNQILILKIKKVNVAADFESSKTKIDMSCRAKFKVGTAVFCTLKFVMNTAKNNKQKKIEPKKSNS
jgi:hypothetical protein